MLNKELSFRVELLQDPSIKWLSDRRYNKMIKEIKEANNIEEEWENIQIYSDKQQKKVYE
jgi:hypothetical protein